MRLAVLGAAGRTGRAVLRVAVARGHEVIAFSRRPFVVPDGAQARLGDALDVQAVTQAVRGCDAVICAIGPNARAPADQDSRLGEVLARAMRTEGVKRLAIVTGAMQAPAQFLGRFYRWLARLRSVTALLDDRRVLEQRLLDSGVEVTILRPPQLTDGPASIEGPEFTTDTVITWMDGCSRDDLAAGLVQSVEQPARGATFIRSRPRAGAFWRAWLVRCGLAEVAGIGLAATLAVGLHALLGESESAATRGLSYASFVGLGALEGAFIGLAQGGLLRRLIPTVRLAPFTLMTMLPAALAWAIGMAPSTFLRPEAPADAAALPPIWVGLAGGVLGGALGGALIGGCQWLALRRRVGSAGRWVVASALGWSLALPLDLLGATLPDAATPPPLIVLCAAGFGLLAGVAFAIPTGRVALGLRPLGSATSAKARRAPRLTAAALD